MEKTVQFTSNNKRLYGILHIPDNRDSPSTIVIILTGGPQVRIGAHRLYVQLSRFLCERNIPSLRFDYEGLGDSEGDFVGFQHAGPSINAAIKFLRGMFDKNLTFIIWSLCDGATAAALYNANHQENISGLILCNPFVITGEGLARSTIKNYYRYRFFEKQFLYKLFRGKVDIRNSLISLWRNIKDTKLFRSKNEVDSEPREKSLPCTVINSILECSNPIRIILSTGDIVASNFQDELKKHNTIKHKYNEKKIVNYSIKMADHTFTDLDAKKEMFFITLKAVNEIESAGTSLTF